MEREGGKVMLSLKVSARDGRDLNIGDAGLLSSLWLRRLLVLLVLPARACLAADPASPTPDFCRVVLQVDDAGKATLSVMAIGNDPLITRPDGVCQRNQHPDGSRDYGYCFSDEKALQYLSGGLSTPVHASINKRRHTLRLQPAAVDGFNRPCAFMGIPYRLTLPFQIAMEFAVPDANGNQTHILLSLYPQHYEDDTKEPIRLNINLSSDNGFRTATTILVKPNYSDPSSAKHVPLLVNKEIRVSGDEQSLEFLVPLPVGATVKAYEVEVGVFGEVAVEFARLQLTTRPLPTAGCGLQRIGTAVLVSQVLDPSPASEAGMQVGDQILKVNAREVFARADVFAGLALTPAGQEAAILVGRRDKLLSLKLVMSEPNPPPDVFDGIDRDKLLSSLAQRATASAGTVSTAAQSPEDGRTAGLSSPAIDAALSQARPAAPKAARHPSTSPPGPNPAGIAHAVQGLPAFSEEEWEGMLAELRLQGKVEDADEWLPALRLAKKVFVDEKIPKPSPRMICKLMNEFALFNSPPNEAAKKLRELFLAAEGAGVRMATREQLLALEDGHVALPLPRDEQRPMQKHGLMGVFPALGQIPFGISERELRQICPVELKKCECDERLVVEPFRNWEFPGDGVTAVYSDAYPVSDKKAPVQFIFRDDVLVGIGVHCGEADLDGVVSLSKVLEKVYGNKRLMGSRAKMEKVIGAIETKEFVGAARMCFGDGKAILQLEAYKRPEAHVIFSNEDQSKWPEEAKTRRTLQLGGMDM
jgi:hypothetical protein